MGTLIAVTTETFDTHVLSADQPVLVDFWAPRCPPCLAITPWLEELAVEYEGRLTIVKVNVDDERPLIDRFGVIYIPELIVFSGGQEVGKVPGDKTRRALRAALEQLLGTIERGAQNGQHV